MSEAEKTRQAQQSEADTGSPERDVPADEGEHSRRLYPDDQKRVDEFLKRGVNSVERKPFRPFVLLIILVVIVAGLSVFAQWLTRWAGIY